MIRLFGVVLVVFVAVTTVVVAYSVVTGLDARDRPGAIETRLARAVRGLAIPRAVRDRANPLEPSAEVVAEGMSHYADHCASCHANNGSGDTELGRGLFPKPPDMRLAATQDLTDGALFYIIEHGVRFTGMPGWSTGTESGENASWQLVHFIRRLPKLTDEELERMQAMNPRSPAEIRQELEEERFLRGDDTTGPQPNGHSHGGAHK
jgi:mono/diheme cytochrome c family protein